MKSFKDMGHPRDRGEESGYGHTSEPILQSAAILQYHRDPNRVKWEEMVRKRTVETKLEQIYYRRHCDAHAYV
jgi:hypothetical protein